MGPEPRAFEAKHLCVCSQPSLYRPTFLPLSSLSADVPKVEVLEQELAWLKEHLSQLDSPVVFCHNDLLCKNIIYDSTKGMASLALATQQQGSACLTSWFLGFGPQASTWTSKVRPSGIDQKLICRREMRKKQIPT